MRWLVGWSSAAPDRRPPRGQTPAPDSLHPVGGRLLWADPDPLWAVGDWHPDEIRIITSEDGNRLAVFGRCSATDGELRAGLWTARGGAFRHLTAWPGSYTAVTCIGRRLTVPADLAGARPVFHTPFHGGTAYATAALPLADLAEAQLDFGHLASLLACPDAPEALADGTPYEGVRRVPQGHALILRDGTPEIADYEPPGSLVVTTPRPADPETALTGMRDALIDAVRARLTAPRHTTAPTDEPGTTGDPAPGIGADLSGGPASGTLALLAAGLPGNPGTVPGAGTTSAGERLLAVTFNDLATHPTGPGVPELERARAMGDNPRLHHLVVTGREETLPYGDLDVPLTDEPGPSLVSAARDRHRLAAGSADHLVGTGARQVLDAHPARLADLLLDRRRRHLLRPVTALARAEGVPASRSVTAPWTVYRAARRLARTPYRDGMTEFAAHLRDGGLPAPAKPGPRTADDGLGSYGTGGYVPGGAIGSSLAALTWGRPGPAARWLTGEALAEVSFRIEAAAGRPVTTRPGDRRARAALARLATDQRVFEQAVEVRNQRIHAPFLDNQVVRAARALPETLRIRPGSRAFVLRAVLAGAGIHDLPPGWGAAGHAGRHAAERAGLRLAADTLTALFDAPLLAEAGLVEARIVRTALRNAADGDPLPLDGIADLVSTELWLRRLLTRRGSCWAGEDAPAHRAVAGVVPPARTRPAL